MIARTWTGRTRIADADRYLEYLRETGLAECLATPGNRGVEILRRLDGDEAEFRFVSYWDDLGAIRAFAGDDPDRAVYYPEDARYLLAQDPLVSHYEVAHGR